MTDAPTEPREERLRPTSGLRGTPALALSAWRGRSGRRYVVGVHEMLTPTREEHGDMVAIAVRRDSKGIAAVLEVRALGPRIGDSQRAAWVAAARKRGATELHLHKLCETPEEFAAVVEDLLP